MPTIKVDNLASEINKQLGAYNEDVTREIKKAVDDVAKECLQEIKSHITFNNITGDYEKAMKIKTTKETRTGKIKTWYVESPHYRLTHLLERGHKKRNGKDETKAFPHIIYGEQLIEKELPKRVEEILNDN